MCGRYGIHSKKKDIEKELAITMQEAYQPTYNAAPTQALPIITDDAPKYGQLFHWGLIPQWAKDKKIAQHTINARAETLLEKPSFKKSIRAQRCLVTANGYYEWKKEDAGKQPYWICLPQKKIFAMAGIWDAWKQPENGEWLFSFSIITVPANNRLAPLHDRMPAILAPKDYSNYLDRSVPIKDVLSLLQPMDINDTNAYPVSKEASAVANNHPQLIHPTGSWLTGEAVGE